MCVFIHRSSVNNGGIIVVNVLAGVMRSYVRPESYYYNPVVVFGVSEWLPRRSVVDTELKSN